MGNTVHIAGRGSVVRQLRILVSQFRVLQTGTLFEIRPDNMYHPLAARLKPAAQTAHLVFANAQAKAKKTKRAIFSQCLDETRETEK